MAVEEECMTVLTDALIDDCSVTPVLGLKSGVIVNYDDVDWDAFTATGATVSSIPLLSGKSGFPVKWLKRKGQNDNSFVASPTEREGFLHSFLAQLGGYSAENSERIKELSAGKFVLFAESNYRGKENKDAFKVFGITAGLYLSESSHNSNENNGAILYNLGTLDGDLEEYLFQVYSEGTYAATKDTYDSLFAAV